MKITIENVQEVEKGWIRSRPIHKLYVTLEITNEERFVLEKKDHLISFELVKGVSRGDGQDIPHKPTIRASRLLDTNYSRSKIRGTANRLCIFSHAEIDWVNYNEDLLREGLKKWKQEIDKEAGFQQKRPASKTLDL